MNMVLTCGMHGAHMWYTHGMTIVVCMVQVLVDKNGCADEAAIAELGPGSLLSVSQVAGRG